MGNTVIIKPHAAVKVIMVQYDLETKEAIRTLESLNFDKTSPDLFSKPIVIKMNVSGATKIKNIRLGIVKASQEFIAGGSTNSDHSVTEGNFGIEHANTIIQKSSLSSFFPGINTTITPADENNILINNLTDNGSEYIYLNVRMLNSINRGYVGYKWFFDFI